MAETLFGAVEAEHHESIGLRVDYVVVAYRSADTIEACLDSIEADRPHGSAVIIVDNASPDESASIAAHHRSTPRVVASERNLGFGRACNDAASLSDADILFFVNPDARLQRGVTEGLARRITECAAIVAAGPRVVDPSGRVGSASAGYEPSIRSVLGHFLMLARLPVVGRWFSPLQLPPGTSWRSVDWVGGAALMVEHRAFEDVGGFDPAMFLYMEDVDLCRRLRENGGAIYYEPQWAVEHDIGGSQGPEQGGRWFEAFHRYMLRRHGQGQARLASAIAALGLGLRAVASAASGQPRPRLARASLMAIRLAFRVDRGDTLPT